MTTGARPSGTRAVIVRATHRAPTLRRGLIGTALLAAAGTALALAVPVFVQQIIDNDLLRDGGVDVAGVARKAAATVVVIVLAALAQRQAIVRLVGSAAEGLADLRVMAFGRIHRQPVLQVQGQRRGALVARVTSDVETVFEFMEWGGVGMMIGTAQMVLTLAVMVVYDWRLALVVTAGVAVYGAMIVLFQRILQRAHDRVRAKVSAVLAALGEAITALPVIRAYGNEQRTLERLGARLDDQFDTEFRTNRLGAALFSSAELFAGTITAVVVVLGVWLGISAGTLIAFLFLVNLLVEPVQVVVETLDQAQSAAAGLRRVLESIDGDTDFEEPEEPATMDGGPISIAVSDLDYAYGNGPLVLEDVDVEVRPGTRLAVVGETGSGKTTFAKLIARILKPTRGSVRVSGVALDRIDTPTLRRRVAYVPQEGFLFTGTIADNVRYGRLDATDDDIAAAFEDLDLGDWLRGLPAGLATDVGERGTSLSAGERQLVALARAWIARPDLLILDEATSAVDPDLDVRIRKAIERMTRNRTSVTIAHRLATAAAADEVLVFDRGRIVERGRHDELVARGGVYADLHADWTAGTAT